MSDAENFVARWSRLKRDTAKQTKDKTPADAPGPKPGAAADEQGAEGALPAADALTEPAFDPASLPSIESITGSSDIRAFLQKGVPAELTKAALRRVWTTDPAIRDFIGIAENQWDFTDPTAMPGFGPLEATDNVRELVAQAMGKLGQALDPSAEATGPSDQGIASTSAASSEASPKELSQVTGMPVGNEPEAQDRSAANSIEVQTSSVDVATQHDDKPAQDGALPSRRTHGRALPQ
jgi:hypothetical protein